MRKTVDAMSVIRNGRTNEPTILPPIELADGKAISVQASAYHYASPRDNTGPYTAVEVWVPGEREPRGWVSIDEVEQIIEQHGGRA